MAKDSPSGASAAPHEETSKEELQSLNEELGRRVAEAEAARSNLANLLRSARIATVFLDRDLVVRSFTPAATEVLRLVPTDVGRPISDVRFELAFEALAADARAVLEGLAPLEREAASADGREFSVRVSPYRSEQDAIEGVVITFVDVTRLRDAEASRRRLATVVADSNDAVAVVDLQGVVLEWNRGATEIYGYTADDVIGRSFDVLLPEGAASEPGRYMERWTDDRKPASFESRRRRKDGTEVDVSSTATPLADSTGRIYAIATTDRDISAQKRREAQLEFLLRELDHRVKNSLTTVLALVDQTASSTDTPQECAAALKVRISALVDLHEALAGGGWGDVGVVQMARTALTPNAAFERQLDVQGDDCHLPPHVATPVFMALHELAVNARKHGALSAPEGHVQVDVAVDPEGAEVEITWRETGGPPVHPPRRRGFGMTVIQRGLEYEAGGRARIQFEEAGLTAHLAVPLQARGDGEL